MLKIVIEQNTLIGNIKSCEVIDNNTYLDIHYHKNVFPNYKIVSLEVLLPIDIPDEKVTNKIKKEYLNCISKMYDKLRYMDYDKINNSYLRTILIHSLNEYGLSYNGKMF
jgi:hypothetical protein